MEGGGQPFWEETFNLDYFISICAPRLFSLQPP